MWTEVIPTLKLKKKIHHINLRKQDFKNACAKVEFAKEGILFSRTDFLPWEFLLTKKLEIEKTKTTLIISVLKVEY